MESTLGLIGYVLYFVCLFLGGNGCVVFLSELFSFRGMSRTDNDCTVGECASFNMYMYQCTTYMPNMVDQHRIHKHIIDQ